MVYSYVLDAHAIIWHLEGNAKLGLTAREATALMLMDAGETVALLTKDVNIAASGLVPVIW